MNDIRRWIGLDSPVLNLGPCIRLSTFMGPSAWSFRLKNHGLFFGESALRLVHVPQHFTQIGPPGFARGHH